MRHHLRRALALFAVAASAGIPRVADADPTVVTGATAEGTFGSANQGNADATGAFGYSVPLDLPRGRGLVQPRIALGYSSSARTGNAGFGWSLSVPSIERKPLSGNPVFGSGGLVGSVFDARFTYGGRPLVLVCQNGGDALIPVHPCAGTDLPANAWPDGGSFLYFRAQVEDGTPARFLLKLDGTAWRVQLMGGLQMTFGGDESAVERDRSPAAGIVRWHLTSEVDARNPDATAQDRAVYRWSRDDAGRGHSYLTDVFYTPPRTGAPADTDFAYHVELSWTTRANQTTYGSPLKTAPRRLLSAIGVSSMPFSTRAARLVERIYRLDYMSSREAYSYDPSLDAPLFHEAFLKRIRQEGRCNRAESGNHIPFGGDCATLPPIRFSYEPGPIVVAQSQVAKTTSGTYVQDRTTFYDVNGVGIVDITATDFRISSRAGRRGRSASVRPTEIPRAG